MGRPSLIDKPSPVDPSKTNAQALIAARGIGQSLEGAAEAVGIGKSTVFMWQRRGQLAQLAVDRGQEVPESERPYLEFTQGLTHAFSQGVLSRLTRIQAAAICTESTRVTIKEELRTDEDGNEVLTVIERTTVTTRYPQPQWDAWYLERALPDEFGRRMELTGRDGAPLVPIEDRARGLGEALEAFQAGIDAKAAIEADKGANG